MSGDLQLLPIGGEIPYTFDFSNVVPAGVSVSSIDIAVPAGLVKGTQSDDLANKKSTVILKDTATHACVYFVKAIATLSNGAKEPQYLTVRVHQP